MNLADYSIPTAKLLENAYARNYWTFAAFGVLIADYLATFVSEFSHIWKRPITFTKVAFWLSRYIGLLGQGINCYLLFTILSPMNIPIDPHICYSWYAYQIVLFWFLFVVADVVMILRVAAWYNCHRVVRAIIIMLPLLETALAIFCGHRTAKKAVFSATCEPLGIANETVVFGVAIVLSQSLVGTLTLSRRVPSALGSLTLRRVVQGVTWAPLLFISLFLFIVPYSHMTQTVKSQVVFAWPNTLISLATCRLIVNMHETRMPVETDVDMDDSNNRTELESLIQRQTCLETISRPLDTDFDEEP